MDRGEVRTHTDQLPTIDLGRVPEGDEAWEGDENGAHFIVTKVTLGHGLPVNMLDLTVSGPLGARRQLIIDFCEALGEPIRTVTFPEEPDRIDHITWLIPKSQ